MPSKRRLRRKICGSKIRFESLQEAIRNRRDLWAYSCDFCGGYHAGHHGGAMVEAMHVSITKMEFRAGR